MALSLIESFSTVSAFTNGFSFSTGVWNGGSATYVNQSVAVAQGVLADVGGAVWMGTKIVANERISVRLNSRRRYTGGVWVFDVAHVPIGCGAWPALWMINAAGDEVDVLENINVRGGYTNFHTNVPGCVSPSIDQVASRLPNATRCTIGETLPGAYKGCISSLPTGTFDASFNSGGGGIFVLDMTDASMVDIYRVGTNVPVGDTLDLSSIKGSSEKPLVRFDHSRCNGRMFEEMQLVINLNLCGGWASGDFEGAGGCFVVGKTCKEFVLMDGITEAYWAFRDIRWYAVKNETTVVDDPVFDGSLPGQPKSLVHQNTGSRVALYLWQRFLDGCVWVVLVVSFLLSYFL